MLQVDAQGKMQRIAGGSALGGALLHQHALLENTLSASVEKDR
jgi:hypothetical protein